MARKCDLTGVGVMSGNNVPKSRKRTKRDFLPNLKETALTSDALGVDIALKITADVLRTINKYGGLDAFIMNYKSAKLTDGAKKLKKKIKKSLIKNGELENIKVVKKAKYRKSDLKKSKKTI